MNDWGPENVNTYHWRIQQNPCWWYWVQHMAGQTPVKVPAVPTRTSQQSSETWLVICSLSVQRCLFICVQKALCFNFICCSHNCDCDISKTPRCNHLKWGKKKKKTDLKLIMKWWSSLDWIVAACCTYNVQIFFFFFCAICLLSYLLSHAGTLESSCSFSKHFCSVAWKLSNQEVWMNIRKSSFCLLCATASCLSFFLNLINK